MASASAKATADKSAGQAVPLIETESLTKLYGIVIGLNDVTVRLEPGAYGLLGPNGAGKTTLLHLVTGQLRPTKGTLRVLGEVPWNNPRLFRQLGLCPEPDMLYPFLSGHEFVRALLGMHGFSAPEARRRAGDTLELVGLKDAMHRRIGTYSRGMRQRVKLAQALAHDPPFLLLDEPMNGLDPIGRMEMARLLKHLAAQGRSIIVASHVIHEVEDVTDRFLLIYRGRLLAAGERREIRAVLSERPHRVRVRCDRVADLARALIDANLADGLELEPHARALSVMTRRPGELFRAMPRIVEESGIAIEEMSSPDESMEAVFRYLVEGRA